MQNLSSQKLFLGLAALAGVGLLIYAFMAFRPQTEPQVLTPPPAPPVAVAKVPKKIGIFQTVKRLDPVVDGFKQGLAEHGYVEGKDVVYVYENSNLDDQKEKEIARRFLDENMDLVLAIAKGPSVMAEAMKAANKYIPVVATNNNPKEVGEGKLYQSYKSSGNTFTGIIVNDVEVNAKRIEFIRQLNPNAKKVGVFYASSQEQIPQSPLSEGLKLVKELAPKFGIEIVDYILPGAPPLTKELQQTADAIKQGELDAILMLTADATTYGENAKILIDAGKRLKIPTVAIAINQVQDGALFGYNHDTRATGKQAAAMADKIFKGTKPSDIPLERPKKNELVLNLKTAKEIGVTIPESLLAIADKKIE